MERQDTASSLLALEFESSSDSFSEARGEIVGGFWLKSETKESDNIKP